MQLFWREQRFSPQLSSRFALQMARELSPGKFLGSQQLPSAGASRQLLTHRLPPVQTHPVSRHPVQLDCLPHWRCNFLSAFSWLSVAATIERAIATKKRARRAVLLKCVMLCFLVSCSRAQFRVFVEFWLFVCKLLLFAFCCCCCLCFAFCFLLR